MDSVVLVALAEAISFGLLVHLWRRYDRLPRKLLWSLVLLVPGFGPLFYGALYDGIDPQRPRDLHRLD